MTSDIDGGDISGYSEMVRRSLRKLERGTDEEGLSATMDEYSHYVLRKYVFIAICVMGIAVVAGLATTIGSYPIGFTESYHLIWQHLTGNIADPIKDHVVWDLRLPRILVAVVAGAGLAVAGVAMQSTLKNPLADPYTTGISSGAAFGATVGIVVGSTLVGGEYSIILNAFVFALIPAAMIIVVSGFKNASPTVMILSGLAIMYIFNAMTTVLMLMADPDDLAAVYKWQVGSLASSDWTSLPIMSAVTVAGMAVIAMLSNRLNVLSTGDDSARSLGVDAGRLRLLCLVVVSLMSASIVSFTGIIGFVGLVSPHIVRIFIGSDNRYLIPASAGFGAVLLLVADLIGRTVISPAVLQVGVVTAFLGGPLFLYLIVRQRKDVW